MGVMAYSREVLRVLWEFAQIVPVLAGKKPKKEDKASLATLFEDSVARSPHNIMLLFEGRQWTYSEFNAEVNQLAHLLAARGVKQGDCVAVLMENRAEFILVLLALAKLGAPGSLINSSLSGNALVHCLKETSTKKCIVGAERTNTLAEIMPELAQSLNLQAGRDYFWVPEMGDSADYHCCPDWAEDIALTVTSMPQDNLQLTREISATETAMYVFTSGTTGLPKASVQPHFKYLVVARVVSKLGFQVKPTDRLYLCLPLYHSTGMMPGLVSFMAHGASIFLRRTFSASNFWPEVQKYQTNCFVYVGELCRYLADQPESAAEKNNSLMKMMGNGLRPDVWDQFRDRFGVQRICELYGASEGNFSFLNVLNKDKTIGAALSPVALVQYDIKNDSIVRDGEGHCIEVPLGEPGLLLGKITSETEFEGYTNPEATTSKIVENVQIDGDRWFNSGDLVRQIDVGFAMGMKHFQFVDRTGDTFRWRAENVSTNEVAEVLNSHPQITMANVYGVEMPAVEGRAGMVAFQLDGRGEASAALDINAFQSLVERELPGYAQPVFIRVLRDVTTTATFKLQKNQLREEAYHPDRVDGDTIYVRKPRSDAYELLDAAFYQQIVAGTSGY
jgi:citronellyl-CoA synthetase